MPVYNVTWIRECITLVRADNPDEAREKIKKMDNEGLLDIDENQIFTGWAKATEVKPADEDEYDADEDGCWFDCLDELEAERAEEKKAVAAYERHIRLGRPQLFAGDVYRGEVLTTERANELNAEVI